LLGLSLAVLTYPLFAQPTDPEEVSDLQPELSLMPLDTLPTDSFAVDSFSVDSLASDSARSTSDLDTIVSYSADWVETLSSPRVTTLIGNAKVSYKSMELTAHKIVVTWDENLVRAEGVLDTIKIYPKRQPKPFTPQLSLSEPDITEISSVSPADSTLSDSVSMDVEPPDVSLTPFDKSLGTVGMIALAEERAIDSTVVHPDTTITIDSTLADADSSLTPYVGEQDSSLAQVPEEVRDSIYWKGLPRMKDADQILTGSELTYNMKSRRGRVVKSKTALGDGFYNSQTIKRMDTDTYFIESGHFTTCDADEPHYTFWSREVKMIIRDKVIAKPVVLYFGHVPVFIIPFGVFSTEGGRRSGIIIPTYGESSSEGRYFRDLGYYWAPNDYYDVRTSLDFFESHGIRLRSDMNYALRYVLNGRVGGSLINWSENSQEIRRWDLNLNHRQTLSPTSNLNLSGTFVSDGSYYRETSQNLNQRMAQTMTSNATVDKRWEGTPYYGSLNLYHSENLVTGNISQTLPQISISRSSSQFFTPPKGTKVEDMNWWNRLYYSYNGWAKNNRSVTVYQIGDTENKITKQQGGVQHNLSLSGSFSALSYISLSPGIQYSEQWFDAWNEYSLNSTGKVDTVKHKGFRSRRTFSTGISASTKLYGLFKPHIGSLEAIRHTLSPSLGFNFVPDYSDKEWGYYTHFTDITGRLRKYDQLPSNGVFSGSPQGKVMSMSIGLGNYFEYKQLIEDKEVKGKLFDLNLNTGYNFVADSLHWANLSSGLSLPTFGKGMAIGNAAMSGVTLMVNGSHSFYALAVDPLYGTKRIVDRPAENGLRLLSFDLTSSFSLEGKPAGGAKPESTPSSTNQGTIGTPPASSLMSGETALTGETISISGEPSQTVADKPVVGFTEPMWTPSPLPWKAGISFRYGEDHSNPDTPFRSVQGSLNLETDVTKNWKVSYSTTYDFVNESVVASNISIYRDLHCWEGRISWNPVGVSKGYFFVVNIKSSQLKDIKVEKSKGGGRLFGY